MRVLVATSEMQGVRDNDYCFTSEGEPVYFGFECDGESVDGECGCRRGFAGMLTHKATTTAKVVDNGMSEADFTSAFIEAQTLAGWFKAGDDLEPLLADVKQLMTIAVSFPVDMVVEKRGATVQERRA